MKSDVGARHAAPEMITWEERAAIMEYDGGLTRPEAERLARDIVGARRAVPLPPQQQDIPGLNVTYRHRTMREEL